MAEVWPVRYVIGADALHHSIFGRSALSFDSTGRAPGTVCAGVQRQHPQLLQDTRAASDARAYGARDAAAPQAVRYGLQVPVRPFLCRLARLNYLPARCRGRPSQGGCRRRKGDAHGRARTDVRWPRNYCRILRFSPIAALLTALYGPLAKFTWVPAEKQSFYALKAALTSAPLHVLDLAGPTRLLSAHWHLGAGRVCHPGATRRRWRVPSLAVAFEFCKWTHLAGALVSAPHAGVAGGGARAQGSAALPPWKALRAAHWQRQPAVATTAHHVSHHQARWLNLLSQVLAEYLYRVRRRVVHVPGRINPAEFHTRTADFCLQDFLQLNCGLLLCNRNKSVRKGPKGRRLASGVGNW